MTVVQTYIRLFIFTIIAEQISRYKHKIVELYLCFKMAKYGTKVKSESLICKCICNDNLDSCVLQFQNCKIYKVTALKPLNLGCNKRQVQ